MRGGAQPPLGPHRCNMTLVPRFHHVNLGVSPGALPDESTFLVDVLGYRKAAMDERVAAMGAQWFEAEDGSQVHLSEDPNHRAADRAHVAVEFGPDLGDVEQRLDRASVKFKAVSQPDGTS